MAASNYEITANNKQFLKSLEQVNEAILKADGSMDAFGVNIDEFFKQAPKGNVGASKAVSELTTKLKLLETTQKELNKLPDDSKSRIEGLKKVSTQMDKVTDELKKYGSAMKKYEELQGFKKAAEDAKVLAKTHETTVKSLDRATRAQERLNKAQQKQSAKKAADDAKKLAAALSKAATIQAKLAKLSTAKLLSFDPKNLNQANAAMSELTKRRNALNKTDKNYLSTLTKINQKQAVLIRQNREAAATGLERSVKRTTAAMSQQSGVMQQLQRQFGIYFSVIQAQRFVSEMVKIRGEFELQHVALSAMLQDQELAINYSLKFKKWRFSLHLKYWS
jgi:DNA repair exonuclease SbcCD ATPase subunit